VAKQAVQVEFNKVNPATKNQAAFVKAVKDNDIIFCEGVSGTGKTYLTLSLACEYLLSNKVEKILISHTIVPCGDIGFLPGSASDKSEPYFYQHLNYLEKILGKSYKRFITEGKIILKPLEVLRGYNFDNTIMIADEIQNFDAGQIKMFLTRLGKNSKAICLGDASQKDINTSGLIFCLNNLSQINKCTIINFEYDDILRSGIIGDVIRIFNKHGY
jgi:phosphate starvation-inducible PhoH-like protein